MANDWNLRHRSGDDDLRLGARGEPERSGHVLPTPSTGGGDFKKLGPNVVTLSATPAYSGNSDVSQGELRVTGTLNGTTGTRLTFNGTSRFTIAEATGANQGMGLLLFNAGDGTIQSLYAGSGISRITFTAGIGHSAGATGNSSSRVGRTGRPTGSP